MNTACTAERVPTPLRTLFEYVNSGECDAIDDNFVKKIDKIVQEFNANREVRQVMDLETQHLMNLELARREANRETAQKIKKGIPVQIIAECAGLSEKEIEQR